MRKKLSLTALFTLSFLFVFAQLTLKITTVPTNTPLSANIHLASNFNNWNPGDANAILQKQENGTYQITINPPSGQLEFKFTRGSWATVEGNAEGSARPNRVLQYNGQAQTVEFSILSWEDLSGQTPQGSTAAYNVNLLSQNFFMPQLNRNRRIWIYLPPDYATSGKRYPVLYMHDAQNLFDARTSFSGEWQVDEALNRVFDEKKEGLIVIGIENGGANRVNEYAPWNNPRYGGGEGDEYAQFIVETLKPYVDANYRTQPGRQSTGIAGSSMGGLISLFAGIEYQEVFSKVGVFSPSLWFAPQTYTHVSTTGKDANMKFYLLAGQLEDNGSVVRDLEGMYNTLRSAGFGKNEIRFVTHTDGQHSEWYWAREFPAAYRWLFAKASTDVPRFLDNQKIKITQSGSMLRLKNINTTDKTTYRLFNADGTELRTETALSNNGTIDISDLKAGNYVILLYKNGEILNSQAFKVK
ncbi:MAG: alpha/beta hydrolase-fold protein [Saprospiraceae bacterium]|nr:alpha/beta hydrolase-fold protein [Saprospiraceae bacterium]